MKCQLRQWENDGLLWDSLKHMIQTAAGRAGYRIIPDCRDAMSLRRWLLTKPIHTVIDVGASRGETSREWLNAFPSATVHSIEPLPSSFAALKALEAPFAGRFKAYNFAIGKQCGRIGFRTHPRHHTSSSLLARTDFSAAILPGTEKENLIQIEITTLDDLFAEASMQEDVLVKLDVQGVELDVIAGADRFLKCVKYLLTEISLAPVYVGQSDFNSVHVALTQAGFVFNGFIEQFHADDNMAVYADVLYVNPGL